MWLKYFLYMAVPRRVRFASQMTKHDKHFKRNLREKRKRVLSDYRLQSIPNMFELFAFHLFGANFLEFQNPPAPQDLETMHPFLHTRSFTHPTKHSWCHLALHSHLLMHSTGCDDRMMYTCIHYNAWDEKKITSIMHLLLCRRKSLQVTNYRLQQ